MQTLKCVVIGDGSVGKTCMLSSYVYDKFSSEYHPTVFDNYTLTVLIGGDCYTLDLFDSAGHEEYDKLRPLGYPQSDVFLVCFSVVCPISFHNVKQKWIPDIKRHTNAPYLLIGLKADMRNDSVTKEKLRKLRKTPVSYEAGHRLAKKIRAVCYLECSARTTLGLKNVFVEAILTALEPPKSKETCQCKCCVP